MRDTQETPRPILIAGLPRSGTTWVGEIVRTAADRYVFEPDNEKISAAGWIAKQPLHRFPYLADDDRADAFLELWRRALAGRWNRFGIDSLLKLWLGTKADRLERNVGERCGLVHIDPTYYSVAQRPDRTIPYDPAEHRIVARLGTLATNGRARSRMGRERVVVKTVHSALSLEWIARQLACVPVVVLRNPFSLFASYQRLRMPDAERNVLSQKTLQRDLHKYLPSGVWPTPRFVQRVAFQITLMYRVLASQLTRHPEWIVLSHDRVCLDAEASFRALLRRLGVEWNEPVARRLRELNRAGAGFSASRVTRDEPLKWRREISGRDEREIRRCVEYFELEEFLHTHVDQAVAC